MSNRNPTRSRGRRGMIASSRIRPSRHIQFHPRLESIESRILLTTYTVGPGNYSTITAAVNKANSTYNAVTNPSNTVIVSPGTYSESNITITTPMTLISTSGSSGGAAHTIIEGPGAFTVTGTDGVIDVLGTAGAVTIGESNAGFTIENPPTGPDDNTNLIYVQGIQASLTVGGNTFMGASAFGYPNQFDTGVVVEGTSSNAPVFISNNTFEQMWQGILLQQTVGAGSIDNNIFENLQASSFTSNNVTTVYEPEGIFALTFGGSAYNVSGMSIDNNDFSNFNGLAISVDGGYAGYTPAQFSNLDISGNDITSIGFKPNEFRAGITLIDDADSSADESAGGVVNSTVEQNTLVAQTACAAGSIGVWVLGGDNGLTIQNNYIENLDSGVLIQEQVTGAGYASGMVVTQNSFTGNNIGINNPSSNAVSAPYNYWGAIDSTSVKAQANGGVNVDYNPWLASNTSSGQGAGFHPSLTPAITDAVKISGSDSVQAGQSYTLTVLQTSTPLNVGTITGYTVNWGDNTTSTVSPYSATTTHTYNPSTQTTYPVSATATFQVGTSTQTLVIANTLSVTATVVPGVLRTFVVTSFTPTVSGFHVRFNDPLKTSVLNLYDNLNASPPQTPDVTVTGPSGAVYGSLKLDSDNKGFSFVATGPPLVEGSYTVTLVGAANGVVDNSTSNPLDGTYSGSNAGSNYSNSFSVASNSGPIVSIPDFARGPGQPVDVPAATSKTLPIQISDGTGITSVMVILTYNPTLLTIAGATLDTSVPAGTQIVTNSTIPGRLAICITSPTPMNSGLQTLVDLAASVPTSAPYLSKAVLGIQLVDINGSTTFGVGDQAIEDVTFIGNASGSGDYSSEDVALIRQVLTSSDFNAGFPAFPLVDPTIIGNVSATGNLNSNDASILRHYLTSNDDIPQIPDYTSKPTNTASGPDPELFLPQTLAAMPGNSLTVPVEFKQTNDAPIELQSFSLVIQFDPSTFSVASISQGDLSTGFQFSERVDAADGLIFITGISSQPLTLTPGTLGNLAELDFSILSTAKTGSYSINLLDNSGTSVTSLNGGGLTLVPAPTNAGNDPNDGQIAIGGRRTQPAYRPGYSPVSRIIPSAMPGSDGSTLTGSSTSVTQAASSSTVTSGPQSSPVPSPISAGQSSLISTATLQLHDLAISTLASDPIAEVSSSTVLIPLTTGGISNDPSESATVPTARPTSTIGVSISPRGFAFRNRVLSRVIASSDPSN